MTMSTFAFLAHISVSNSFNPHFKLWWCVIIAIQCLLVCDIKSSLCELHHHHPQIPLPLQTDILYPPSPPSPPYLWIDREEYPRRWGGQGLARTQWVWEQCIPPCHLSILTHWTLCIYWSRHSQFCIFLPAFFHVFRNTEQSVKNMGRHITLFCDKASSTFYFTHYK